MAEQFAGGKLPRKAAAVYRDEGGRTARTVFVYHVGGMLLARPALADDEDRHVRGGYNPDVIVQLFRGRALSVDDVADPVSVPVFVSVPLFFLRYGDPRRG